MKIMVMVDQDETSGLSRCVESSITIDLPLSHIL